MNDADGAGEPEGHGAMRNFESVFGIFYAAAENGIDVHLKDGVLGKIFEFRVEHLQTFFGNFVGLPVVDADLQMLEAGLIQALDAIGHEIISISDEAGDHAALADVADRVIEFGMEKRFAAADGDDGGAEA